MGMPWEASRNRKREGRERTSAVQGEGQMTERRNTEHQELPAWAPTTDPYHWQPPDLEVHLMMNEADPRGPVSDATVESCITALCWQLGFVADRLAELVEVIKESIRRR